MNDYNFYQFPKKVPFVKTKYRKILTKIPHPKSLIILNELKKSESRSMHGQLPLVWDKAVDFLIYDKYGNCWIDFTSTIFVTNSGHSNIQIINAVRKQLDKKLLHTYTFASDIRLKFLKKLIGITPAFCEKAFLLSSGTEATECALKLMRMYGKKINSQKNIVISFIGNMHGRTMGAEMLNGVEKKAEWIGYLDPNIFHLPFPGPFIQEESGKKYDWIKHFQKDIIKIKEKGLNFNNICGFMIEPYQGWGAVFFPKDYIKAISDFSKKYNILVTFDEIQGGFGRTGKQFVYQHYDVEPDLICLGKGISGSLPLSAVIGRQKILDLPEVGSMSSTHSANPLSCAAGLANLNFVESENLVKESERKGKILHKRLNEIKNKYYNRISFICGKGLLAGIIIKNPVDGNPDKIFASKVCEKAMQKGLLLVHTGRESIKIGPPLTIPDDALIEGIDVLEESIKELNNS